MGSPGQIPGQGVFSYGTVFSLSTGFRPRTFFKKKPVTALNIPVLGILYFAVSQKLQFLRRALFLANRPGALHPAASAAQKHRRAFASERLKAAAKFMPARPLSGSTAAYRGAAHSANFATSSRFAGQMSVDALRCRLTVDFLRVRHISNFKQVFA